MIARIAVAALGAAVLGAALAPAQSADAHPRHEAAPARFTHAKGFDASGYYMPTSEIRVGRYKLDSIDVADPAEFAKWERGQRSATFAPVMVEVSDTKSPKHVNELGQAFHAVRARVLPDSYRVAPGTFEFTGHDAKLGRVIVSGAIDAAVVARARRAGPNARANTAVTAGLEMAGEHIRNASFSWFGGD